MMNLVTDDTLDVPGIPTDQLNSVVLPDPRFSSDPNVHQDPATPMTPKSHDTNGEERRPSIGGVERKRRGSTSKRSSKQVPEDDRPVGGLFKEVNKLRQPDLAPKLGVTQFYSDSRAAQLA